MVDDMKKSSHSINIIDREKTEITGVIEVVSFDEETAILETTAGVIVLKGQNIHMSSLNLNTGEVGVEGYITALSYSENQLEQKHWFLSKLLK